MTNQLSNNKLSSIKMKLLSNIEGSDKIKKQVIADNYELPQDLKRKIDLIKIKLNKKQDYSNHIKPNEGYLEDEDTKATTVKNENKNNMEMVFDDNDPKVELKKKGKAKIKKKTRNIIDKLLSSKSKNVVKQSTNIDVECKEINDGTCAYEKYKDLLVGETLPLPIDLKNHLTIFKEIDTILYSYNCFNKTNFLNNIISFINTEKNITVTLENILKIMELSPWTYTLNWKYNEKYREDKLIINFNCSKEEIIDCNFINKRYSSFSDDLYKYTKDKYILFTQSNNIKISNNSYDKYDIKVWSHKFDLHEIKLEAMATVPPKKCVQHIKSINELLSKDKYIQENDVKKIIESNSEYQKNSNFIKNMINNNTINSKIKGFYEETANSGQPLSIRDRILEEIKIKERIINQIKLEKQNNSDNSEVYFEIVNKLKLYYNTRNVSNMFLVKIIEYLCKNLSSNYGYEEIKAFISKIIEYAPEWGQLIENNNKTILKLNKGVDYKAIRDKLFNKYN